MMGAGIEITLENPGRVCSMNRLRVVGTREGGAHQEYRMDWSERKTRNRENKLRKPGKRGAQGDDGSQVNVAQG